MCIKIRAYFTISLILCLGGCAAIGPVAISDGRTRYNKIIQDTAKEQTLLNIVRVYNSETPLFLDVSEVDESTTAQAAIAGGPSGLGSIASGSLAGPVGFITGGASYQEAPTIRYQPLSGQALIAQISTPLSTESLARFFNSDWPLAAVLQLSSDRLTPGYLDYFAALNAIVELDQYGAIMLAATTSKEPSEEKSGNFTFSSSPPADKDSLTIYFEPKHTAIAHQKCDKFSDIEAHKVVNILWKRLLKIYGLPETDMLITLRTTGTTTQLKKDAHGKTVVEQKGTAPWLQTRTALGILKEAEPDQSPAIAVLEPNQVERIIKAHSANEYCRRLEDFYEVDPSALELRESRQDSTEVEENKSVSGRIENYDKSWQNMNTSDVVLTQQQLMDERSLGTARRFMLIANSSEPPPAVNTYAAVQDRGRWYYILDDDHISKRTLALITQLNTIQAVPSQSPPLTPSITVGGRS